MGDQRGSHPTPGDAGPDLDSTFELIRRARSGDRHALERLFQRHLGPLKRWASGRLPRSARDVTDTDDLVQDTLLRTLKTMDGFEPRRVGALQAYLRQAILNRLRDELRHKQRMPGQVGLDTIDVKGGESPLEEAIGRETVESYEQALARLRPEEREAIIGRVELGLSYDDLAAALGKTSSEAARKAAKRALYRLAEEMRLERGR